ncbi:phospholipid-translocating ATPase, partial [Clonorchis sinensis]
CSDRCRNCCRPKKIYHARVVNLGRPSKTQKFPSNKINNQKYSIWSFVPLVLFEQFSIFLNLIYLILACSQFIPDLRVGALYTYWGPLAFVLCVSFIREAIDDIRRFLRDREVNQTIYGKIMRHGQVRVTSAEIKVGDMIHLEKNQRVPADMVLLWTSDRNGSCFIRTDQLDGETDWKLRHAVPPTQTFVNTVGLPSALFDMQAQVFAEAPRQNIHLFEGTFARTDIVAPADIGPEKTEVSLNLDHTLWSNTVLATGSAIGLVIYTGNETRAVMNSNRARTKMGKIDREINNIIKLLFAIVVVLAFVMVALRGFNGAWYKHWWRFMVLFSYIIPLALRVNMDLAKIVYSFMVVRDRDLPGCMVRNTTIPEELGRIAYLMSDKTGTLTQNEMVFKKLHLGTVAFAPDSMEEVAQGLQHHFASQSSADSQTGRQMRRSGNERMSAAVLAVALCHNVTPMTDDDSEVDKSVGDVKNPLELIPQSICLSVRTKDKLLRVPDELLRRILSASDLFLVKCMGGSMKYCSKRCLPVRLLYAVDLVQNLPDRCYSAQQTLPEKYQDLLNKLPPQDPSCRSSTTKDGEFWLRKCYQENEQSEERERRLKQAQERRRELDKMLETYRRELQEAREITHQRARERAYLRSSEEQLRKVHDRQQREQQIRENAKIIQQRQEEWRKAAEAMQKQKEEHVQKFLEEREAKIQESRNLAQAAEQLRAEMQRVYNLDSFDKKAQHVALVNELGLGGAST